MTPCGVSVPEPARRRAFRRAKGRVCFCLYISARVSARGVYTAPSGGILCRGEHRAAWDTNHAGRSTMPGRSCGCLKPAYRRTYLPGADDLRECARDRLRETFPDALPGVPGLLDEPAPTRRNGLTDESTHTSSRGDVRTYETTTRSASRRGEPWVAGELRWTRRTGALRTAEPTPCLHAGTSSARCTQRMPL